MKDPDDKARKALGSLHRFRAEGAPLNPFGSLLSSAVWPLLGCQFRREAGQEAEPIDQKALSRRLPHGPARCALPRRTWRNFRARWSARDWRSPRGGGFLLPGPSDRLGRAARELCSAWFAGGSFGAWADLNGLHRFRHLEVKEPPSALLQKNAEALRTHLEGHGLELDPVEFAYLKDFMRLLWKQCERAKSELEFLKPGAVLVYADNHAPCQPYVFAARERGIPSILLQHGLDVEHFFLDEAFASHLAVWSEDRRARYLKHSERKPTEISVCGNPQWDDRSMAEELMPPSDRLLWFARPHSPLKCFLPSRLPREGAEILRSLVAITEAQEMNLEVKFHPADQGWDAAQTPELTGRYSELKEDLASACARPGLVVAEDSTAALEAMAFGLPVIHVHFAKSPPVLVLKHPDLPNVAHDRAELRESVKALRSLASADRARLHAHQRSRVEYYLGPMDGRSGERFVNQVAAWLDALE